MITDLQVIKATVDLLDKYRNDDAPPSERVDQEEFLSGAFANSEVDERVAELFFRVLKYEVLFDLVLSDYYDSRSRRFPRVPNDYSLHLVFLYYGLIEMKAETLNDVTDIFLNLNTAKALSLAGYTRKSTFLPKLFEWGAHIWDVDHVRDLFSNLVSQPVLQDLHRQIRGRVAAEKVSKQKKLTKPMDLRVLKRTTRCPILSQMSEQFAPQESTENTSVTDVPPPIKPTPIPRTTYLKPNHQKKLEKSKREHQQQARQLYEEAQKNAFRVANKPKTIKPREEAATHEKDQPPVRSKKVHKKEPRIQPRKTAAVILREGARLMKMEQDEIKRLEDIMRGAFNSESLKELECEIQRERTRKEVEEIEKKHLQGQLTYEEALIAKQKYLKKTKEGAEEFRKERELWLKQLDQWRAEEQIRIRESVEKGKSFEKGAKEAVEHVKEEKHRMALETMEESKSLKEKWLAEKEEELKRKIQIIKEIKALQTFGTMRRKETMSNAAGNVGSLCEMSTEELRERLMILRLEMKEEIEKRREEIKQKKECRQAVVDGYRDLIEQHREIRKSRQCLQQRSKNISKSPVRSSSVEALKKKLDLKRRERLHSLGLCNA